MIVSIENAETISYGNWQIEIRRKAFRRRISVILKPGKPVQVNVGRLTPIRSVLEFLESRREWIDKHLTKFQADAKNLPDQTLKVGAPYPYMGRMLTLKLVPTPLKRTFASIANDDLLLHVPVTLLEETPDHLDFAKPAIRALYKHRAEKFLKERTAAWSEQMKLKPSRIRVREAKTRWGSCNRRAEISLNWRLIVFDASIIDYVIVHELAHIKHLNHSKKFWDLVEQTYPETAQAMREIKEHHRLSDFLSL